MVDSRNRVMLNLKGSHIKQLKEICRETDSQESEVFLDALKFYHRDLIRTGVIQREGDVAVRVIRRIASVMGNDDIDNVDDVVNYLNTGCY